MFGPLKKNRSVSPKRKPFVSTTKKVTTFGVPPPLPPVVRNPSPVRVLVNEDTPPPEPPVHNITFDNPREYALDPANYLKLQQQSVRWLNLSSALWSMIVLDANRAVDKKGVVNILTAMMWRLHGEISEEEFTGLFLEWMGPSGFTGRRPSNKCGVLVLRDVLLEQSITEENLDVLLGMAIFEVNRRLLSSPLSFSVTTTESTDDKGLSRGKRTLEICSKRWLSLSEELFFMLDTPGFGFMGLDEFIFLGASLLLARRDWACEADAERCFSAQTLAAVALYMMRQAGATVDCSSSWAGRSGGNFPCESSGQVGDPVARRLMQRSVSSPVAYNYSGHLVRLHPSSTEDGRITDGGSPLAGTNSSSVYVQNSSLMSPSRRPSPPLDTGPWVSLPMFKSFLMKRGLGEGALLSLITLIRECTELVATLSAEKRVDVLCRACVAYGGGASGGDVGPPKVWHSCVYGVSGYPYPDNDETQEVHAPPVLLFLLCDGLRRMPGAWVAAQPADALEVDESGNDTEFRDAYGTVRTRADLESEEDVLLHHASYAMWTAFCMWGEDDQVVGSTDTSPTAARRDSVYQFIMSVLAEYKASLMFLCAAFVDIAMDHFSGGIAVVGAGRNSAAGIAAASLLPSAGQSVGILREMFPDTSSPPSWTRPPQEAEICRSEALTDDRYQYPLNEDTHHLSARASQGRERSVSRDSLKGSSPENTREYNRPTYSERELPQTELVFSDGMDSVRMGRYGLGGDGSRPPARHDGHIDTDNDLAMSPPSENRSGRAALAEVEIDDPLPIEECHDNDLAVWLRATTEVRNGADVRPAPWNEAIGADIQNAIWATVFDTKSTIIAATQSRRNIAAPASATEFAHSSSQQSSRGEARTSLRAESPDKTASDVSSLNFSERRRARRRRQGGLMTSRFRRRDRTPVEATNIDDESVLLDELMHCEEVDREMIIDQLREIRRKKALDKLYAKESSPVRVPTHREGQPSDGDVSSMEELTGRVARVAATPRGQAGRAEISSNTTPPMTRESEEERQHLSVQAVSSLRAAVEAMEAIKRSQEKSRVPSSSDQEKLEIDSSRDNGVVSGQVPVSTSLGRGPVITPTENVGKESGDSPASKVALSEASSLASSVIEMLEKGQTAGKSWAILDLCGRLMNAIMDRVVCTVTARSSS